MIVPSYDGELVAILMDNGKLWVGQTDQQQQLLCINITGPVRSSMLKWCGTEALLAFPYATESPLCRLINMHGHMEDTFLPEFVTASQEVDGTRVFTLKGQEFFQLVPRCLLATFDLRLSNSSSAELRYAAEEFYHNKSHTADDYMRKIGREVDVAVADCIESAGYVWNPLVQKELLRAAQLGKTFWNGTYGFHHSTSPPSRIHSLFIALHRFNIWTSGRFPSNVQHAEDTEFASRLQDRHSIDDRRIQGFGIESRHRPPASSEAFPIGTQNSSSAKAAPS